MMSYKSWRRSPPFCALGVATGLVLAGCHGDLWRGGRALQKELPRSEALAQAEFAMSRTTHERRLLPRLDGVEPSHARADSDGRLELIVEGLRIAVSRDGTYEVGEGVFPIARQMQVLSLPRWLGSKVLFALSSKQDTWLFASDGFMGSLRAVGTIDVPARTIVAGVEGTYATLSDTDRVLAIDLDNGRAFDSTVLPPAPEYGPIAFVDEWFGGYVDPLRGLMTTEDAGLHWGPAVLPEAASSPGKHARPSQIASLTGDARELLVHFSDQRLYGLARGGHWRRRFDREHEVSAEAPGVSRARELSRHFTAQKLGEWPMELAVTRGVALSGDMAAVLVKGQLAFIRLRDGKTIKTNPASVRSDDDCMPLQSGSTAFFWCLGHATTTIERLSPTGRLEHVTRLDGVRRVVAVSPVGLVLDGSCSGNAPARYCAVRIGRAPTDVVLPRTDVPVRVAMFEDGALRVIVPPSVGRAGRLFEPGHPNTSVALELPRDISAERRELFHRGTWREPLTACDGGIAAFVVGGDSLMGLRLSRDGAFRLGEIVAGATRAAFDGQRVLVPDGSGFAYESQDGGRSYTRPWLPDGAASTTRVDAALPTLNRCSSVGCRLGRWLRVGWSAPNSRRREEPRHFVEPPPPLLRVAAQARTSRLSCSIDSASQATSFRPLTVPERDLAAGPAPQVFGREWQSDSLAISIHPAAPRAARSCWTLETRVEDPLRHDGSWSVRGTAPCFASPAVALDVFGAADPDQIDSGWSAAADLDGDGVLLNFGKHAAHPWLCERGHEFLELEAFGPRQLEAAARLLDGWYLFGTSARPVVSVLAAGTLRSVSDFDPRARLKQSKLRFVKNRDRSRVAYAVATARLRSRDVRWFVYPLRAREGTVDAPTVVPLDRGIRACEQNEDGWLLETNLDAIADVEVQLGTKSVSARAKGLLLLKESGICLDRVLIRGTPSEIGAARSKDEGTGASVPARYLDDLGHVHRARCRVIHEAEE